jgi:hypothetical protein
MTVTKLFFNILYTIYPPISLLRNTMVSETRRDILKMLLLVKISLTRA